MWKRTSNGEKTHSQLHRCVGVCVCVLTQGSFAADSKEAEQGNTGKSLQTDQGLESRRKRAGESGGYV